MVMWKYIWISCWLQDQIYFATCFTRENSEPPQGDLIRGTPEYVCVWEIESGGVKARSSWALITQRQPNRHFMCNALVYWRLKKQDCFLSSQFYLCVYVLMIIATASVFEHIKKITKYWYFHTHYLTQNVWMYTLGHTHTHTHTYTYPDFVHLCTLYLRTVVWLAFISLHCAQFKPKTRVYCHCELF